MSGVHITGLAGDFETNESRSLKHSVENPKCKTNFNTVTHKFKHINCVYISQTGTIYALLVSTLSEWILVYLLFNMEMQSGVSFCFSID